MDNIRNILYFTVLSFAGSHALSVTLSSNGPVVLGANITFTATVNGYQGEELKFNFYDNLETQNRQEFILQSNISQWVVEYPRYKYSPGEYTVYVKLFEKLPIIHFWTEVAEASKNFLLTDNLNGKIVINQNNTDLKNKFVFVNQTASHSVSLPVGDEAFLKRNTSSIVTYWFIDCVFKDQTVGFQLNHTYIDSMKDHKIDALVVGNTQPLPPIPTTTAATKTTTMLKPNDTTTLKPNDTTTMLPVTVPQGNKVVKRDTSHVRKKSLDDFICNKNNIIPLGDTYIYGHYELEISVREPVRNVNITGMNWLQHGDLMNLQVKFAGSPPFDYCAQYKSGEYNVTGNETCHMKTRTLSNEFPLIHYFANSDQHTVVVIIENEIWKQVSRATINIYKVTPHAQLSVIVVPVVFCLLAVTLVVFGVAYYIQNRARYTVEVADFDFGQQAHLDYKTFVERLRDSFRNAFNFTKPEDTESLTGPSNAYDSMT